ncbi:hypothetical protein WA171_005990 [Blastocystis sp. BT1]
MDGFVTIDSIGMMHFFAREGNGWKMVLQRSLGCAVTMAALNESGTIVFIGNESEVVKVVNLASGEVTEVTTNCQRALSLVPFELGDQEMLVVTSSSSISVIDVKMNKRLRITMEEGQQFFYSSVLRLQSGLMVLIVSSKAHSMSTVTFYSLPVLKRIAFVVNRDNQCANLIVDLSPLRHNPIILITYQSNQLRLIQFNSNSYVCSLTHIHNYPMNIQVT